MSNNKFWTDDIKNLFSSTSIIPRDEQSVEEQHNSLTRLSMVASIGLALFFPTIALTTFVFSIASIVASHYYTIHKAKEKFTPVFSNDKSSSCGISRGRPTGFIKRNGGVMTATANEMFGQQPSSIAIPATYKRFCNDFHSLDDENSVSVNQLLVGGPNPKTFIPPIVAPPSHDLNNWRATELVTHSHINAQSNFDISRSGYEGDAYYSGGKMSYSGYGIVPNEYTKKCEECYYVPCKCKNNVLSSSAPLDPLSKIDSVLTQTLQPGIYQRSRFDEPINSNIGISLQKQFDPMMISSSPNLIEYTALNGESPVYIGGHNFGTNNHRSDLRNSSTDSIISFPTAVKEEYRNISFRNEDAIGENINEIISFPIQGLSGDGGKGPSFDYGFDTGKRITTLDNALRLESKKELYDPYFQSESNVFDPRFTGYGDSSRGYLEPMTGQPRFVYDDIDCIKMPNFISRNNVDVFPWAVQYGQDIGVDPGDGYKQLANDAFLDSALTFRTEMQERLLRKRNAEMWQLRVAPISTQNNTYPTSRY